MRRLLRSTGCRPARTGATRGGIPHDPLFRSPVIIATTPALLACLPARCAPRALAPPAGLATPLAIGPGIPLETPLPIRSVPPGRIAARRYTECERPAAAEADTAQPRESHSDCSDEASHVTATDGDLPANCLTYAFVGAAPAGAQINLTNGLFTWTPGAADAGTTTW